MEKRENGSAAGSAGKVKTKTRLPLLDTIRGLTLISMIAYHACWDAVYLLGAPWRWYESAGAYLWQQSICWTFILLSGFCVPLSRHLFRRGAQVFGAGALVTAVTVAVLPEDRVVFGVLTLLGSCMLILALVRKLQKDPQGTPLGSSAAEFRNNSGAASRGSSAAEFRNSSAAASRSTSAASAAGLVICVLLFVFTRHIGYGFLGPGRLENWAGIFRAGGAGGWRICLPSSWYRNLFTTYLGLPMPGFFSTDYFPLFPWLFLYLCGFFAGRIFLERGLMSGRAFRFRIGFPAFMGRHSLLIYLLHQPVLYLAVLLIGR